MAYVSSYGTRINTKGITGKPLQRIQTLADSGYGTKAQAIAKRRRLMIPKAQPSSPATPTVNPTVPVEESPSATIQPLNTSNVSSAAPGATPANNTEGLFPDTRMFEPKNYEGSPLYQFQLKEGQKQVGKSLAARGLTNSGAGIEAELNVPLRAAAQDTDRMTRVASENADRLYNTQRDEALRLERAGNAQWDRSYDIATLMANQSPWNEAVGGLNSYANTVGKKGNAQANFLSQYYNRVMPGGGGGYQAPPVAVPSGPNYTNIDPTAISGNWASNNNWQNILMQGLGSIFPST